MNTPSQNERDLFKDYINNLDDAELYAIISPVNLSKEQSDAMMTAVRMYTATYLYENGYLKRTP